MPKLETLRIYSNWLRLETKICVGSHSRGQDEIEQLAKAADKREAAKIKKEPTTPIEKVKERKRPETCLV